VISWRSCLVAVVGLFTISSLITAGQRLQDEVYVSYTIILYAGPFTVRKHVPKIYGNRMVHLEHQKQKETSSDFDQCSQSHQFEIFGRFRYKL
jgi:hypothetical protein